MPSLLFPARHIVEPDEVDLLPLAVLRNLQQIQHAQEARLACQLGRDIRKADRLDRFDDDLASIHWIASADLHVRPHPEADAAGDSSVSNALAQAFGESHGTLLL